MTEDPLKDLLGFDPESGDRIEERGNLKKGEGITPEIQQLFLAKYQAFPGVLRIEPQYLFLTSREKLGNTIYRSREYFVFTGDNDNPFDAGLSLKFGHKGNRMTELEIV